MPTKATLYLCLCVFLIAACNKVHYQVVNTGHEGQPLPSINLLSVDSSTYLNIQNITLGSPLVLFYFRPECSFCQSQIADITEHITSFQGSRFYLVAANQSDTLRSFFRKIQSRHLPNFFVCIDYNNNFQDYFSPEATPYTVFYRRNKTLSRAYLGELTDKDITHALHE